MHATLCYVTLIGTAATLNTRPTVYDMLYTLSRKKYTCTHKVLQEGTEARWA